MGFYERTNSVSNVGTEQIVGYTVVYSLVQTYFIVPINIYIYIYIRQHFKLQSYTIMVKRVGPQVPKLNYGPPVVYRINGP